MGYIITKGLGTEAIPDILREINIPYTETDNQLHIDSFEDEKDQEIFLILLSFFLVQERFIQEAVALGEVSFGSVKEEAIRLSQTPYYSNIGYAILSTSLKEGVVFNPESFIRFSLKKMSIDMKTDLYEYLEFSEHVEDAEEFVEEILDNLEGNPLYDEEASKLQVRLSSEGTTIYAVSDRQQVKLDESFMKELFDSSDMIFHDLPGTKDDEYIIFYLALEIYPVQEIEVTVAVQSSQEEVDVWHNVLEDIEDWKGIATEMRFET